MGVPTAAMIVRRRIVASLRCTMRGLRALYARLRAESALRRRVPLRNDPPMTTMNYRRLGRSGLKVSELSFGSWVTYGNQMGEDARARMHGGRATTPASISSTTPRSTPRASRRRSWATALKKLGWRRSSYVVSTKFYWGLHDGPNEKNTLNRKYLMQAIDASLARLAARLRRPRVLPSPRSRHADRGNRVRDARHDRARARRSTGARRSGAPRRSRRPGRSPTSITCTSR